MANDFDDQPASEQAVPLSIGYFADAASSLLPAMRAMGVIMIMMGSFRLIAVPAWIISVIRLPTSASVPRYLNWIFLAINAGDAAVAVVAIIGGVACLRRRPGRRNLALIWSYTSLALAVCYLAAITAYTHVLYTRGIYGRMMQYEYSLLVMTSNELLARTSAPLVCLILLRGREGRKLFSAGVL